MDDWFRFVFSLGGYSCVAHKIDSFFFQEITQLGGKKIHFKELQLIIDIKIVVICNPYEKLVSYNHA